MDVTCIFILATGINLEDHKERFTKNDVEDKLEESWSKMEFSQKVAMIYVMNLYKYT